MMGSGVITPRQMGKHLSDASFYDKEGQIHLFKNND